MSALRPPAGHTSPSGKLFGPSRLATPLASLRLSRLRAATLGRGLTDATPLIRLTLLRFNRRNRVVRGTAGARAEGL